MAGGSKSVRLFLLGDNRDAKAKIDEIDVKSDELAARHPELKIGIDTAAAAEKLAILRAEIRATTKDSGSLKDSLDKVDFGKLGTGAAQAGLLATAAGPLPVLLGGVAAGAVGVGAALVPAVAGLGLFGAVAKSAYGQVQGAVQQYDKAMSTSGKARTSALKSYNAELAALTPSQQAFAKSIEKVSGSWNGFVSKNQSGVTSVLNKGLGILPGLFSRLQPLLPATERGLDGVLSRLGHGVNSAGFKAFTGMLAREIPGAIGHVSSILGHLGSMAGKVIEDFSPLGNTILADIDKILGKADAGTNSGIQKFLTWIHAEGPQVVTIVRNLGVTVGNMGRSFIGLGSLNIGAFVAISNLLATISKNPIGAGALVGLVALVKVGQAAGPMIKLALAFKTLAESERLAAIGAMLFDAIPIVLVITGIIAAIVLIITHWKQFKEYTLGVWHAVTGAVSTAFNWVKSHWPLILGIVTGPVGAATAFVVTHWRQISHFASVAVSDIGRFFGRVKGLILGVFAGAGSWLVNAGRDVVMGAVHGIESAFGSVTSIVGRLAGLIPSGFKRLLGIASPSRVMRALAAEVPNGIVSGLEGGASQVQSSANKLSTAVRNAFVKGVIRERTYSRLNSFIAWDTGRLKTLANERAAIVARIHAADQYANNVTAGAESSASLSSIGQALTANGGMVTAGGIIAGLQGGLRQIQRFTEDVRKLGRMGLNKNLLDQIIQMGPVDGTAYADALISGGAFDIRQVNSLQGSITNASQNLGRWSANVMYDSGRNAGKGFLSGLQSQEKQITQLMQRIARNMVSTIRRDLGIHSPSRVMAEIGGNIADGLTMGITAHADKAVLASRNMVRDIANPSVPVRSLAAATAGSGRLEVEWVGSAGADAEFISWLKKNIRIRGGDPAVLGR